MDKKYYFIYKNSLVFYGAIFFEIFQKENRIGVNLR